MGLDPVECRVLGCLIEKQRTTPDAYPLSLNALRLACNQSTNRDPVVSYDDDLIRTALQRLYKRGFTRLASSHSSRSAKYRHLLDDALSIDLAEQAVLAVLLLRGDQTPGELKQRTERMEPMSSGELQEVLTRLIDRELVAQLARRPGQKEERFRHRLSEDLDDDDAVVAGPAPAQAAAVVVPPPPRRDERLERLERELTELRDERVEALERDVLELRAQLEALRSELGA
jgi:uncharacterized protein YceH (UPF0502 family)